MQYIKEVVLNSEEYNQKSELIMKQCIIVNPLILYSLVVSLKNFNFYYRIPKFIKKYKSSDEH